VKWFAICGDCSHFYEVHVGGRCLQTLRCAGRNDFKCRCAGFSELEAVPSGRGLVVSQESP
jgi:hypothetical protein